MLATTTRTLVAASFQLATGGPYVIPGGALFTGCSPAMKLARLTRHRDSSDDSLPLRPQDLLEVRVVPDGIEGNLDMDLSIA